MNAKSEGETGVGGERGRALGEDYPETPIAAFEDTDQNCRYLPQNDGFIQNVGVGGSGIRTLDVIYQSL